MDDGNVTHHTIYFDRRSNNSALSVVGLERKLVVAQVGRVIKVVQVAT